MWYHCVNHKFLFGREGVCAWIGKACFRRRREKELHGKNAVISLHADDTIAINGKDGDDSEKRESKKNKTPKSLIHPHTGESLV